MGAFKLVDIDEEDEITSYEDFGDATATPFEEVPCEQGGGLDPENCEEEARFAYRQGRSRRRLGEDG